MQLTTKEKDLLLQLLRRAMRGKELPQKNFEFIEKLTNKLK